MAFKLIALVIATTACLVLQTQAATTQIPSGQVAAFYLKDAKNGQLRFLGNGVGGNNAGLNQYINNKQDWLEQFRPTRPTSTVTSPTTTGSFPTTTTGTSPTTTTPSLGGVQPIVINANKRKGNRKGNRYPYRKRVNRRRPGKYGGKRRGSKFNKNNNNKGQQIYLIRPKA